MTETQVLTDAEIDAAITPTAKTGVDYARSYATARAVERAVLAKVGYPDRWMNGTIGDHLLCVPEVEARERQRIAYEVGAADWAPATNVGGLNRGEMLRMRDRRYPSLRPQTPPPLTLSTGRYRKPHGERWQKDLTPVEYITVDAPLCKTAADAYALAVWLRQYGER